MNSLEIVRLAGSKHARDLTVQEVVLLRKAVSDTPALYHLLGGREEFGQYLAQAPDLSALSAAEIATIESGVRESLEAAPARSRVILWTTACLAFLLVAAAGVWLYHLSHRAASPVEAQPEEIAARSAEEEGGNAPSIGSLPDSPSPRDGNSEGEDQPSPAGALGTVGRELVRPLDGAFALFEDEGRFTAVDERAAGERLIAPLAEDDRHAGRRSVRVVPGHRFRLELDHPLPIRANPGDGEYRYLRFAFRKFGGGRAFLELEIDHGGGPPIRYDAGQGLPSHRTAHRVWGLELPSEWIVMTRDLFRDFGPGEITSLTLSVPDGEYALFDHIYLERTIEALDGIAGVPSAEATTQRARRALAADVLSVAGPAVVGLEANGHRGTGVLIGNQGHVLTSGQLHLALKNDITVRLADGSTVKGEKAGLLRDANCGVIRIVEPINVLGIKISDNDTHHFQDLHVGFSLTPAFKDGKLPASYLVEPESDTERRILWANFEMEGAELGGPLVDRDGKVVGIHVHTSAEGKMGFGTLTEVRAQWERLTRTESWGHWLPGTGPMIGVVTTAIGGGSRIDRVFPGAPASEAGLQAGDIIFQVDGHGVRDYLDIGRRLAGYDPGDTIRVGIHRDGRNLDKNIHLMPRREFPAP